MVDSRTAVKYKIRAIEWHLLKGKSASGGVIEAICAVLLKINAP